MPRFQISEMDEDREVWRAKSATVEGNFLISVFIGFGQDEKPMERIKAALMAIGKEATRAHQLTRYSWLFAVEARLNDVMQKLVDHLGIQHHSFQVVDLKSGEGLSYDAEKRVVHEIYSKNWMS
jgi:hypothetical protein